MRDRLLTLAKCHSPKAAHLHRPSDLHLTLAFLGPQTPKQVSCLTEVASSLKAKAFELVIDQMDYWSRSKVFLATPTHCPPRLSSLVRELQLALDPCGFKPEQRCYSPHVTLARKVKSVLPRQAIMPALHWHVDSFTLASSSNPETPGYHRLHTWKLR